jgi:glyoxylase-like metal-dependent hydrolase (beta-lactamase superfamily II)
MINAEVLDLPLPKEGFYHFFSSWFVRLGGMCIVVDPGPTASVKNLIVQLKARGCSRIDYLLLTHIHLDHAGGTGSLVQEFPIGKILCHERAIPHLIEPSRLWEGSVQTLGDLAILQGRPIPVPEDKLVSAQDITIADILLKVIPTPGHAPHHISYLFGKTLFVGEALGVILPESPTYLRPATPPRFLDQPYKDSIQRLRAIPAETLCFGHYGKREREDSLFDNALSQIDTWIRCLGMRKEQQDRDAEDCISQLIEADPLFQPFTQLPSALKARERRFVENSLKGIKEFLCSL